MIAESPNILRNKNAVRIVLRTLQRMQEGSEKKFSRRTFIRYAAIYLNFRGGVTVLTALNDEEMKLVVEELIKNWPSYLEKEQRAKKRLVKKEAYKLLNYRLGVYKLLLNSFFICGNYSIYPKKHIKIALFLQNVSITKSEEQGAYETE
ncbi:hypothetical protein AWM78_16195 [Bacillus subtilis subsp. subtilis]|nr:hypothetical protein AWM78_16195 [Bacillus subtilis subsp. subtilis]GLI89742.1 hypothetical protein ANABIO4_30940 [Bacillus subtilis]